MDGLEGSGHRAGRMEPLGFLRDRAASSCTAAEAEGRNGTVHTPGGTKVPSPPQFRRERSRTDDGGADGQANDDESSTVAWPRADRPHADAQAGAADEARPGQRDPRREDDGAPPPGSEAARGDRSAVEGAVSLFGNGKAEHIGKEDDEGNIEYKRTLARPSPGPCRARAPQPATRTAPPSPASLPRRRANPAPHHPAQVPTRGRLQ